MLAKLSSARQKYLMLSDFFSIIMLVLLFTLLTKKVDIVGFGKPDNISIFITVFVAFATIGYVAFVQAMAPSKPKIHAFITTGNQYQNVIRVLGLYVLVDILVYLLTRLDIVPEIWCFSVYIMTLYRYSWVYYKTISLMS